MEKIILIKYGELTTKKQNRNQFIQILNNNIHDILKKEDITIKSNRVRMYISVKDDKRLNYIISKLQKIFGIHSIVIAYKCNNKIEDIEKKVLEITKKISFTSFKVETKRSDKSFPISSMDFNNRIGGLILKNINNVHVDVHAPEYTVKIEIREDFAYIYGAEYKGAGGYPVGVAGKGLLMLSGGIDSPVAGYLAMKRGIKIECIYFESPPHTSMMARNKVLKLVESLKEYQGNIKIHVIHFTELQEAIYKYCDKNYMITIMRRMMYRISERIMQKENCLVLINGESVGQVASQTLNSMQVINSVTNVPVIRPVACLDKLEIIDISKKIDTYETSILPYEDCCTIFLPKHPVIHPILDKCLNDESKFDYQTLIDNAIDNELIIDEKNNIKKFNI